MALAAQHVSVSVTSTVAGVLGTTGSGVVNSPLGPVSHTLSRNPRGFMPTILGYLNCSFVYAAGDDDTPLPDEVIAYHEEIEEAIESLGDGKCVSIGLSSSDVHAREHGQYFADYVWLNVFDLSLLDDVESKIVDTIRRIGIKFDHEFHMQKHILNGEDSRTVFVRRIYPSRNTNWRKLTPSEIENR